MKSLQWTVTHLTLCASDAAHTSISTVLHTPKCDWTALHTHTDTAYVYNIIIHTYSHIQHTLPHLSTLCMTWQMHRHTHSPLESVLSLCRPVLVTHEPCLTRRGCPQWNTAHLLYTIISIQLWYHNMHMHIVHVITSRHTPILPDPTPTHHRALQQTQTPFPPPALGDRWPRHPPTARQRTPRSGSPWGYLQPSRQENKH